jgi:hypothetical protein
VIFQFLTGVDMKIREFWNMTLCIFIDRLQPTRRHMSDCSVQNTIPWWALVDSVINIREPEKASDVLLTARASVKWTVVRWKL